MLYNRHLRFSIRFIEENNHKSPKKTFVSVFDLFRDYTLNAELLTRRLVNVTVAIFFFIIKLL